MSGKEDEDARKNRQDLGSCQWWGRWLQPSPREVSELELPHLQRHVDDTGGTSHGSLWATNQDRDTGRAGRRSLTVPSRPFGKYGEASLLNP